jgi:hypothetical protein
MDIISNNIDRLYSYPIIKQQLDKNKANAIEVKNTTSEFINIASKQNFKQIEKKPKLKKLPNGPIDIDLVFT